MHLPGQFTVALRSVPRVGWSTYRLGDVHVSHCPTLAVVPVVADEVTEAVLLGHPVHAEGQGPERAGGSYIVIGRDGRIWLDPCGSMGVVYDPTDQIAASTPLALRSDEAEDEMLARLDRDAWDRARTQAPYGIWYPGEITPFEGVRRLLPNHELRLRDGEASRAHLPPAASEGVADDLVETISRTLAEQIERLTRDGAYMTLTAGQDSRLLLACAREHVDRVWFFTFVDENRMTPDRQIAERLRRACSLNAFLLPPKRASAEEQEAWLRRAGFALDGGILEIHPTLGALDPTRPVLPGMAGEIARAYYSAKGPVTPETLLTAMQLPVLPEFVRSVSAWLDPLHGHPDRFVLDLAYVELRLGCWASASSYASAGFGPTVIAASHPKILDAMFRLPVEFRQEQRLVRAVCERMWPELLALPFNKYAGARRLHGIAARALAAIPGR